MDSLREFFEVNRTIVLFVYGLIFFMLGLVIFLHSRRHSRLRLARDLRWLAGFGIFHGVYEWGHIFIPIQSEYLPEPVIEILWTAQILLLALSFTCLLIFGAVMLGERWSWLGRMVVLLTGIWMIVFWVRIFSGGGVETWYREANIWARYLLALPGGLLAAYGLRYQTQTYVQPLNIGHIFRTLQLAGVVLGTYALLSGVIVPVGNFFPASVLNRDWIERLVGVPVEVLRSTAGLILAVTIIRALEVFEIELDQRIEQMEVERVQAAERERIGQEIHDGAIQGVFSASLILESLEPLLPADSDAARRLTQARNVLHAVNTDLRSYMISLRTASPADPLIPSLRQLIADPRFHGLLDIDLQTDGEPALKPMQINHVLAIVQESLSNTLRHARARHVKIVLKAIGEGLVLFISDDGRGFVANAETGGYGLRSMRDRARLLGGQLQVESTPGAGTKVIFTLRCEPVMQT